MRLCSFAFGVVAPARAIVAPGKVFRSQSERPQPVAVGLGTCVLTALSAWSLAPFVRASAAAMGLDLHDAFLSKVLLIRLLIITPLDTAIYLSVLALLVWTASLVSGSYDTKLKNCLVISFIAGATGVLLKVFALVTLLLRQLAFGGDTGPQHVATGLDLAFELFRTGPPVVVSLARHVGVFQIWFVILVAIGLVTMEKMKTKSAAVAAAAAYLCMVGLLVGVDLLAGAMAR